METLFTTNNYALSKKLLDATALRHKALASNIANAETPGYKRVDLSSDFQTQLKAIAKTNDKEEIQSLTASLAIDPKANNAKPDGNNVEIDKELLEMNRTTVEYQTISQLISNSIKHLNTAITGRAS